MYVGARNKSLNSSTSSIVRQINPKNFEISLDQATDRVLFKENYFNRWHAYLTDVHGTTNNLNTYRAGPDFMYVSVPKDSVFPVKVTLYEVNSIEWASYLVSLLTLISLVSYGLWSAVQARLRFLVEKLKREQQKKEEQMERT